MLQISETFSETNVGNVLVTINIHYMEEEEEEEEEEKNYFLSYTFFFHYNTRVSKWLVWVFIN